MDDETFNLQIRQFLKRFGVTAQREIERAVAEGIERGRLKGSEALPVTATLEIPGVLPAMEITGTIDLGARD
jgi:helix-turn-helix protein